jgi:23S rRNA (cytosine1962-C5)-methyltransferase
MPDSGDGAALATPDIRRLAVRVTKDAQRQLRGGHPWVYDASIISVNRNEAAREIAAGDLAVVFDDNRRFLAIGLWDPSSPIRINILHQGKPTSIDVDWWRSRFAEALQARAALADPASQTTAYRCVSGENDGLGGLVLDRFGEHYVIKIYSPAWIAHLPTIVPIIVELTGCTSLVLRWSRAVGASRVYGFHEGMALHGVAPTEPVLFTENGLAFEADLINGQKTGFFLDQRDNRARVRRLATGRRVLDVFSSSGGFSVAAAAGGASDVCSVDLSPHAIAEAKRNMDRNRASTIIDATEHRTEIGDAFRVMERMARSSSRFDMVIIDPPSFAQNQASVERAFRAYGKLTELGVDLLGRGGILVQASCSSRVTADAFFTTVHDAASRRSVRLVELERTGHGIDHPTSFPQGAYLKALFARRA